MKRRSAVFVGLLGLVLVAWGCRVEGPEDGGERVAAPAFELVDLEGRPVTLESLRGRPAVIDFWATWCAPCVVQIPILNAFQQERGDEVHVLGIAIDADGAEAVGPFAEEHEIAYPVLLGNESVAQEWNAMGFPTLFVLTPDGEIDSIHVGVIDAKDLAASVAAASRDG